MSASRFNRKARERLLFIATGLVILVILALIIRVIPHDLNDTTFGATTEIAVPAFWVIIGIHLIILAVLCWKILVRLRGGRVGKIELIIPGIILILMSMFMIDAAGAYMDHQPDLFSVAIILFISAFFDLMTGIILIMLPTRIPDGI